MKNFNEIVPVFGSTIINSDMNDELNFEILCTDEDASVELMAVACISSSSSSCTCSSSSSSCSVSLE